MSFGGIVKDLFPLEEPGKGEMLGVWYRKSRVI